jgi:hypothetical protein
MVRRYAIAVGSALSIVLAAASAEAQSATEKAGYEYDRNMLSNPWALNLTIEACSHQAITPRMIQSLSQHMHIPEANVRHEYCRRIYTAYAKGTIPYDDYLQFKSNHILTASMQRALLLSGPSSPKHHAHS